jgi:cysteinyl-tRNA synthetase
VNFTWEGLEASKNALRKLKSFYFSLEEQGSVSHKYKEIFEEAMNDNLNTGEALATLWKLVKDEKVSDKDKKATLLDFDLVFSFGMKDWKKESIPKNILELAEKRSSARAEKNWAKSDELREEIQNLGYDIKDVADGVEIFKI